MGFVRGLSLHSYAVHIFFYFGSLCYNASLILMSFTCMLLRLCFLLCNKALILTYSLVALPGLRKDIVSLAVVWFCTENGFLASSLWSTSTSLHKRWDCASLEFSPVFYQDRETQAWYLLGLHLGWFCLCHCTRLYCEETWWEYLRKY